MQDLLRGDHARGVARGFPAAIEADGAVTASTKRDRVRAEIAAEHFARSLGAVATVRAVRTQWQRQDLFGADVLGLTADGPTGEGMLIAIQATAGQDSAVTARRRKLEVFPWPARALVLVAQLRSYPDPASRQRLSYAFRVHEWDGRTWSVWGDAEPVPRSWFKATKEAAA